MQLKSRVDRLFKDQNLIYEKDDKKVYRICQTDLTVIVKDDYYAVVTARLKFDQFDLIYLESLTDPRLSIYYQKDDKRCSVDKFINKVKNLINLLTEE